MIWVTHLRRVSQHIEVPYSVVALHRTATTLQQHKLTQVHTLGHLFLNSELIIHFFDVYIYCVNLSDLYARVERADGSSASVWRSFLRHSLQPYLDALRCVSTCPTISQKYKPIISKCRFPHTKMSTYTSLFVIEEFKNVNLRFKTFLAA